MKNDKGIWNSIRNYDRRITMLCEKEARRTVSCHCVSQHNINQQRIMHHVPEYYLPSSVPFPAPPPTGPFLAQGWWKLLFSAEQSLPTPVVKRPGPLADVDPPPTKRPHPLGTQARRRKLTSVGERGRYNKATVFMHTLTRLLAGLKLGPQLSTFPPSKI